MITAFGDIELAVEAVKEGAVDFIQKSWDEEKILSTILAALKIRESRMAIKTLTNQKKHLQQLALPDTDLCFGHSPAMQDVLHTVEKVAVTDTNILILGENGTGKEIIARHIHCKSMRSSEMMVTVDLASLAETLFESELFGYRKGAFTDAKADKSGYLELADEGTLFLDEIGNLSLPMQAKILSVLQNREFTPLGSVKKTQVNLRLISATNKDLTAMVEQGNFRQDLLYRLNTIQIELPPLRERKEDIPILAWFFFQKYISKYGKNIRDISQGAINKLNKHSWPGNIRELKHAIEKAVILATGSQLTENDFSFGINSNQVTDSSNFNLADNEKQLISRAIEKHRGNMSHTAKSLGINRSTLYEKIRRYGL
jgi:DNA-binding NtrC family response regulator